MKLREARKKIFGQGGDLAIHGGGPKFFWMGGTGLDGGGGDSPFMGYGPPPEFPVQFLPLTCIQYTNYLHISIFFSFGTLI